MLRNHRPVTLKSDQTGQFQLDHVAEVQYSFSVRAAGHQPPERVSLKADGTFKIEGLIPGKVKFYIFQRNLEATLPKDDHPYEGEITLDSTSQEDMLELKRKRTPG